ncbi:MAG: phosphotransferase [Alphaproteobacteria bacterium]|nr:phosphotransferase [Alphaproteobacteria bacterium]
MNERELEKQAFLATSGWGDAKLFPLAGDASTRRYIRLRRGDRTAMLMDQPQTAETPAAPANATAEQRKQMGYNAVARLAGANCERFIAVADHLRALGLSAPEIYASDARCGFVLMEDFSDVLFADVLQQGADELELYLAAADVLARLHEQPPPTDLTPSITLHGYDETALLAEVDLLGEWFVPVALGSPLSPSQILEHRMLWKEALASVLAAPPVFVHRDFHAQNLMWLPGRSGARRVGLIDFQDAVRGSRAYDLMSLIEDARRDVSAEIAEATARHYLDAQGGNGRAFDDRAFREQMAVMAAQRNAKIVGIFARLHKRDGKSRYLDYLPRVWAYLNRDLESPALRDLKRWYDRTIPQSLRGTPRAEAVA